MGLSIYKWFLVLLSPVWMSSSLPGTAKRLHPFHVSTTEINHNANDKTLEISCRIFTDDFEAVLAKLYKTKVDLSSDAMKAAMDKLVSDYVRSHLSLKADNMPCTLSYIGFEKDNEAVAVYLQVDHITSVKKIAVTDSLLQDLFDDQMNIIHVILGGNRKSMKLDYPQKQADFDF